jgi:hypothetical protein
MWFLLGLGAYAREFPWRAIGGSASADTVIRTLTLIDSHADAYRFGERIPNVRNRTARRGESPAYAQAHTPTQRGETHV